MTHVYEKVRNISSEKPKLDDFEDKLTESTKWMTQVTLP